MAGHVVVGNLALADGEGGSFVGIDGGNGQRGVIGGRGADDTGVRVGHGGKVAVGTALRGGKGVACGAVQQNAGGFDQIVVLVHHAAGLLGGEAAAGTEGHIDDIHVQQQGVVQSSQNVLGGRAVGGIGEHLEDGQLGLGGLTGEGHVAVGVHRLTGGDTGNMGAVIVAVLFDGSLGGNHISIHVGIVEGEGDLAALIQIVGSQQLQLGGGAVFLGVPQRGVAVSGDIDFAVHLFRGVQQLLQRGFLQFLHGRGVDKGLVGHVQTGVQNTDQNARTLVVRVVGVGGDFRAGQRLPQHGGTDHIGIVGVAQHHPGDTVDGFNVADPAIGHLGGEAADDGGVVEFILNGDVLRLDGIHNVLLQRGNFGQLGFGGRGLLEVQHGHGGVHLVADVQQALGVQLHDDVHLIGGGGDVGLGNHGGIHVVLKDLLPIGIGQIFGDVRHGQTVICGGIPCGQSTKREKAQAQGEHQQDGQQLLQAAFRFLFHSLISFLCSIPALLAARGTICNIIAPILHEGKRKFHRLFMSLCIYPHFHRKYSQ